jgi:gliding motility-associated-like protein
MFNRLSHILLYNIILLSSFRLAGQMSMPDNACPGESKHYFVLPNPGSTYIWRINGVVQTGQYTNVFEHRWEVPNTYLIEVQEKSANGCFGPVRSGEVVVKTDPDRLIIPKAFSPNGDLINDLWEIRNTELYPRVEITVYNRWGQTVWRSARGYPIPWNGSSSRGIELPVDSYHYAIDLHDGSKIQIGTVTIFR